MLEQKVMKSFELILHRKKEKFLLREGFLVCKVSGSSFPSGGIQGAYNFSKWMGGVEKISSKCCKFSSVEEWF